MSEGAPDVPTTLVTGENAVIVDMTLHAAFHQRGMAPRGAVTVGIPRRPLSAWFNGPYSRSAILPFNATGGIDAISQNDFVASVLSVSESFLRDVAEQHQLPLSGILLKPESGEIVGENIHNHHLRQRVLELASGAGALMDDDTELELALLLLSASRRDDAHGAPRENSSVRARAIADAVAFIDAHCEQALTVRALCAATGLPARTLSRGFRERFGIGPKAYINRVRLCRARRALVHTGPGTSIADVANEQGFWHLGQFARDYRRLFGELPSQTSGIRRTG